MNKKNVSTSHFTIKHNNLKKENNTLCAFASFSYGNKVSDYVFYYLEELSKANCDIIFVSTSAISATDLEKLKKYSKLIIETENLGLDFGSWQTGLSLASYGTKYDSLIVANDSVFGPFHDLKGIIRNMNQKGLDMWGMTESHQFSRHVQSYFMYFNKKILQSAIWSNFWKTMEKLADKNKIIQNYELGLSKLLTDNHFKIGAYVDFEKMLEAEKKIKLYEVNPAIDLWEKLILDYNYPFLKRELLTKGYLTRFYKLKNWKNDINEKSTYNTSLISNYLEHFQDVQKKSHPKNKVKIHKNNVKIAIHLHLYYTDLADEFIAYLKRISYSFDLYVTLVNEDQFAMYKFQKRIPTATFLLCENRGKDMGGLITFINHVDLLSYDLILKIHSKKSLNGDWYINEIKRFDKSIENGADWRKLLLDSLIPEKGIDTIINSFSDDDSIGMLGPSKFLAYSADGNEPYLTKLCNDMGLDPYFDKTIIHFSGSMFWIRPDILQKIKVKSYSINDFVEGNILNGGLEHAFERIFGTITEYLGYTIKVI